LLSEVASAMDGPTSLKISNITPTNCVLELNAPAGSLNDLQFSEGLAPLTWKSITNFVGSGDLVTVTDAPIISTRLYRVLTTELQ